MLALWCWAGWILDLYKTKIKLIIPNSEIKNAQSVITGTAFVLNCLLRLTGDRWEYQGEHLIVGADENVPTVVPVAEDLLQFINDFDAYKLQEKDYEFLIAVPRSWIDERIM